MPSLKNICTLVECEGCGAHTKLYNCTDCGEQYCEDCLTGYVLCCEDCWCEEHNKKSDDCDDNDYCKLVFCESCEEQDLRKDYDNYRCESCMESIY